MSFGKPADALRDRPNWIGLKLSGWPHAGRQKRLPVGGTKTKLQSRVFLRAIPPPAILPTFLPAIPLRNGLLPKATSPVAIPDDPQLIWTAQAARVGANSAVKRRATGVRRACHLPPGLNLDYRRVFGPGASAERPLQLFLRYTDRRSDCRAQGYP